MKIAVVIPTLREARRIQSTIASAEGNDVSILVVDGGSDDGTPALAEAAGARVLHSPPGRARPQARGLEASDADVVLFLHADTRLPQDWSSSVRGALEDSRVSGGAFGFRFDSKFPGLFWIEWGVRLRLALFRLPYGDQALFARRSALEAIGGIPQAPIMEDLDLVRGLKRNGRFVLLRAAVETSPRRYLRGGALRTFWRNARALLAWRLGIDRERVARWYSA